MGLILRQEPFGGSIFSSSAGLFLELDGAAYSAVQGALQSQELPSRGYEKAFVQNILRDLGSDVEVVRTIKNDVRFAYEFLMHSAPTLADFQITTRCDQGCPHCYASSEAAGVDVSLADGLHALRECARVGVCQVAFGGGEPLMHPHIVEFLKETRALGMVPNLTTSGQHFNPEILAALREHCGAVGLSLEGVGERYTARRRSGFASFVRSIDTLNSAEIPVVLQVAVGTKNLHDVPEIVRFAQTQNLYGVIFLAYKAVGRGETFDKPLIEANSAEAVAILSDAFSTLRSHTRVGYDCCMAPLIAGFSTPVHVHGALEGCSAVRGSVGITPSLDVVPCTFFPEMSLGNLAKSSFEAIWSSPSASQFRASTQKNCDTKKSCQGCSQLHGCLTGCSLMNLVPCCKRP